MRYLFCLLVAVFISCKGSREKNKSNNNTHETLIYFNSKEAAEMGSEKWYKLQPEVNSKIVPQYLDDIIYVSHYIDANACASYVAKVHIKQDSIFLINKSISEVACTSTRIDKVTYILKNPELKKYNIVMKYE